MFVFFFFVFFFIIFFLVLVLVFVIVITITTITITITTIPPNQSQLSHPYSVPSPTMPAATSPIRQRPSVSLTDKTVHKREGPGLNQSNPKNHKGQKQTPMLREGWEMEKILEAQRFFSQKDPKHRSANKSCPISLQTGRYLMFHR